MTISQILRIGVGELYVGVFRSRLFRIQAPRWSSVRFSRQAVSGFWWSRSDRSPVMSWAVRKTAACVFPNITSQVKRSGQCRNWAFLLKTSLSASKISFKIPFVFFLCNEDGSTYVAPKKRQIKHEVLYSCTWTIQLFKNQNLSNLNWKSRHT